MSGETDLNTLLMSMSPELRPESFVFCTLPGQYGDYPLLSPVACFREAEGLTLVLTQQSAERACIPYDGVFRMISLTVHSSLEAVGLTAAVSSKLASEGISANVIAAYYHDHILVPSDKAEAAIEALKTCSPAMAATG